MMTDKYREMCKRLGFSAEERFIRMLPGGAIGFTAGKPEEVRALAAAVEREGLKMARPLRTAASN